MRQTYIPNRSTELAFKNALNNDLGVYHFNNQTGFGIGGFLKKMFKQVIPIGKSLLKSKKLQKLAVKGIDKAANYGVRKIENIATASSSKPKKQKYGTLS